MQPSSYYLAAVSHDRVGYSRTKEHTATGVSEQPRRLVCVLSVLLLP
jgi:hypothetical protein